MNRYQINERMTRLTRHYTGIYSYDTNYLIHHFNITYGHLLLFNPDRIHEYFSALVDLYREAQNH